MSDEGRELMREERTKQQHQGGNQNKGHQQGNGMHNQVITQSDILRNSTEPRIISKGGDTEHCWRAGPHRTKLPNAGGPTATTAWSQEGGVKYRT